MDKVNSKSYQTIGLETMAQVMHEAYPVGRGSPVGLSISNKMWEKGQNTLKKKFPTHDRGTWHTL